jgi:hypothetical protein
MKRRLPALVLMLAGLASMARAIPAFARKYGYSCEVCHAPIPRLKAFGEEFAGNGYRVPDKEPPRATIDTGDPLLLLTRDLPLAIRVDTALAYESDAAVKPDLRTPFVVKLMSGGTISPSVSYYAYFLMTEDSKIVGLEDAFLSFRDVFGLPLSVVVGQYSVADPIKPSEVRPTFESYRIYKFGVGDSKISLSYDRGVMATLGLETGTEVMLQVVNGNGIASEDVFDTDKFKNIVWRIGQTLAKDRVRVGFLGYHGKEERGGPANTVTYLGPDLRLSFPKLTLSAGYLRRTDSNPFFASGDEECKTDAFLAEAVYAPGGDKGRLFFVGAYNLIRSDLAAVDYNRLTLNASYLLRRNLKWMGEYTRDLDGEAHRLLTGFVVGF